MTQSEIIHKLLQLQSLIARTTKQLTEAEAARDALIQKLADNEGAHDRRPVAVR